jgi:Lsr2
VAERIIRRIVDDLDQTELADGDGERIEFGFRGVAYHLDLSKSNATKFEKALAPYIKAATEAAAVETETRPRKKASTRRGRGGKRSAKQDTAAIRAWANDNGYAVSQRGRIPGEVVEAFQAANG